MNVSTRHGATPYSRHALATVPLPTFKCRPSNRDDQCLTPYFLGGAFNVSAAIARWSSTRGRPERAWSAKPAIPCAAYRSRHMITVGRDTPTRPAIAVFDSPCAASIPANQPSNQLRHAPLAATAAQRTVLVVAHRLSTVAHARQIVVLDQGRVQAAGTHIELVAHSGLYRELAQHQLLA